MTVAKRVVIAGGGLAGARTAFALRDDGFDGRVTIVSEEHEWPYERPPLSKGYLRGEEPIEKVHVRPAADYETSRIDLLRDKTVTAIDPVARTVATSCGKLEYDALVLATGAAPRRLEVPGAQLAGIHYLRDVGDADALRTAAMMAENIVVVGGGWIGSEVAASLRQLGRQVTFLISGPRPLERVLGPEIADVYRRAHVEHGIRFVTGRVTGLRGTGRVDAVQLDDGELIAADLIVVGIGALPRAALAHAAGLRIHRGSIEVDEYLRSSVPDIYAIGDVASAWNPRYGRHMRAEHWDNAKRQGRAVAANIVGRDVVYDRVPYLYSDQYDVGMEYRGYAPDWDEVVVRGDLDRREFHAFWLRAGRVAAAMNVNLWDEGDALQAIVESGQLIDPRKLADMSVPLPDLVAVGAAA
jgi:3-phenylpropionate/trans-cinnamate dioxygenase ferredoxin reductase component